MNEPRLIRIFSALSSVPTAPFREQWVAALLDEILSGIDGLKMVVDDYGNRIVRLVRGEPIAPGPVFVAHLDHPGFLFPRAGGAAPTGEGGTFPAIFEGRVFQRFFEGSKVRLYHGPDSSGIPGEVVAASVLDQTTDNQQMLIAAAPKAAGAHLAMWDVPAAEWDGRFIHGRACDDLAGVSAIIEALMRLSTEAITDVSAIFTTGEEAGFCGALCLLDSPAGLPPLLPRDPAFISVEISGELPHVVLGGGAVIRVGDRASVFDRDLTDQLWALGRASQVAVRRALMDLGTCEATPFVRSGFRAGGICAPVRHYHNMDQGTGLIAAEMVSGADLEALSELIVAVTRGLSAQPNTFRAATNAEYGRYLEKGRRELLATYRAPSLSNNSSEAQAFAKG